MKKNKERRKSKCFTLLSLFCLLLILSSLFAPIVCFADGTKSGNGINTTDIMTMNDGESEYILYGNYTFNDVLTPYPYSDATRTYVRFKIASSSTQFYGFTLSGDRTKLAYGSSADFSSAFAPYSFTQSTWLYATGKQLVSVERTSVPREFYEWFTANTHRPLIEDDSYTYYNLPDKMTFFGFSSAVEVDFAHWYDSQKGYNHFYPYYPNVDRVYFEGFDEYIIPPQIYTGIVEVTIPQVGINVDGNWAMQFYFDYIIPEFITFFYIDADIESYQLNATANYNYRNQADGSVDLVSKDVELNLNAEDIIYNGDFARLPVGVNAEENNLPYDEYFLTDITVTMIFNEAVNVLYYEAQLTNKPYTIGDWFADRDFFQPPYEDVDWLGWLYESISGFMSMDIFPGFNIGGLLAIVIGIPLLAWILKLLVGG